MLLGECFWAGGSDSDLCKISLFTIINSILVTQISTPASLLMLPSPRLPTFFKMSLESFTFFPFLLALALFSSNLYHRVLLWTQICSTATRSNILKYSSNLRSGLARQG